MKKYFKVVLLPLLIFIISCEKQLEDFKIMEPEPKLVLNGFAIADSFPVLYVTRNISLNGPEGKSPLKNAVVKLYKENEYLTTLEEKKQGWYSNEGLKYEEGVYMLEVESMGYKKASVSLVIPPKPLVRRADTISVIYKVPDCEDCNYFRDFQLEIEFENTPDVEEYFAVMTGSYTWKNISYGEGGNPTDSSLILSLQDMTSNAPYIETQQYGEHVDGYRNLDRGDKASGHVLYFSDKNLENGKNLLVLSLGYFAFEADEFDKIFSLYFMAIDKNRFEFVQSLGIGNREENVLPVEPVNIFSNVENGLGIVSGSSVYKKDFVIKAKGSS